MAFDVTAIGALYAQVVSAAQKLGAFETVIQHEPEGGPGSRSPARLAVWFAGFGPAAAARPAWTRRRPAWSSAPAPT